MSERVDHVMQNLFLAVSDRYANDSIINIAQFIYPFCGLICWDLAELIVTSLDNEFFIHELFVNFESFVFQIFHNG